MTCVISAGLLPTPLSTSGRGLLPTPIPACRSQAGLLPTPIPACRSQAGLLPTPNPVCKAGLLPTPNPACKAGLLPNPAGKAGLLPTPIKPKISSAQDAKKLLIKKISPAIVKKKYKKVGKDQEKVLRELIWAGPSYLMNSPPPSELPIPKFLIVN